MVLQGILVGIRAGAAVIAHQDTGTRYDDDLVMAFHMIINDFLVCKAHTRLLLIRCCVICYALPNAVNCFAGDLAI